MTSCSACLAMASWQAFEMKAEEMRGGPEGWERLLGSGVWKDKSIFWA